MNTCTIFGSIRHRFQSINYWLALTLGFATLYAGLALQTGFSSEYIVQDDARVYLIWMERFLDPELFSQDLIANYFQSVTPWGLGALYKAMTLLGFTPLVFSKLLPLILSLLLGWYGYRLTVQLFPVPIAGFLSSLILLQSCWQRDDLAAASPRSFWELLLTAFLYYLARRAWLPLAATALVMSLFCPLSALLIILLIGLRWLWAVAKAIYSRQRQTPIASRDDRIPLNRWIAAYLPKPLLPELGVAGLAIVALLPYVLTQSEFAPTVTAAQAKTMPEFLPGGRLPFFYADFFRFWFDGTDSGVQIPFNPPLLALGLLLPWLVRWRRLPLLQKLRSQWQLLPQLALAGVVGFFIAHAVFVKMHFPSRYTTHSWRVAMAISAGIVLTIGCNALLKRARSPVAIKVGRSMIAVGMIVIALYPHFAWRNFPNTGYVRGSNPQLYQFLQTTPKTSMTAYLGFDASNLPLLAHRPTLTAQEYALPFHLGYYRQIRQRVVELLQAQYSSDLTIAKQLIQRYAIAYWLLDRTAFEPTYLQNNRWLRLFEPITSQAIAQLKTGQPSAIAQLIPQCRLATKGDVTVLDAQCLLKQ